MNTIIIFNEYIFTISSAITLAVSINVILGEYHPQKRPDISMNI